MESIFMREKKTTDGKADRENLHESCYVPAKCGRVYIYLDAAWAWSKR